MNPIVMTVSQLNRYVKSLIEGDSRLAGIFVSGEISNFKVHDYSGHAYFSLKDGNSLIKCVCFKSDLSRVRFMINDGMKVLCSGRVSIYERDGNYQYYVQSIRPEGIGEIALSFEQLKEKLAVEGLFDIDKKRRLPKYPQKIGVITAPGGAALKDIMNISARRFPLTELVVFPALVQGADAPSELISALKTAYAHPDIDLIIIGRGGGASEDLSAFNDETLARTLSKSPVPTISAVGHETDFTICDFVADLRAPTPSAAAELALPDGEEIKKNILERKLRISSAVNRKLNDLTLMLDAITRSNAIKNIGYHTDRAEEDLNKKVASLNAAYKSVILKKETELSSAAAVLNSISPLATLSRGYSVAVKNKKIIKSATSLNKDDEFKVILSDGEIECKVI